MATKKKKLGRGLDALLGDIGVSNTKGDVKDGVSQKSSSQSDSNIKRPGDRLAELPVEKLQRGVYQPRSHMDDESLQELADSIKAQGILQPILVRPAPNTKSDTEYEIIAGERRWRASQIAQLDTVPVIIRDIPDEATLAVALIENIQRENLNPIEEAVGLHRLMEEFELTHQQVADHVGRSRSAVSNLLRLLALEERVKDLVFARKLEMGHVRALLALPKEQQYSVAESIVYKQLSVRQTESLIKKETRPQTNQPSSAAVDPDIRHLEDELSNKLQAQVTIQDKKGKGKLIINYSSLSALDGILKKIT